MKLIKSLTVLSLSTLMAFSAYANTQNNQKQPVKKTQTTKTQSKQTKSAPASSEQQLKKFTDSISLRFMGIDVSEQNNQPQLNFKYEVQNTSKSSIKTIHWSTTYFRNGQAILVQDVPITFEKPFKPKVSVPLTFSVLWDNLPEIAKEAFLKSEGQVSTEFQAKTIIFWNGTKIEVK